MLLLNIQSSPRGAKSASIAVTNAFLDAYRALHSDATIDTLNVWEENLPDFDQEAIGAKYKGVNKQRMAPGRETAVWNKIQELAVRFQQADRYCHLGGVLGDAMLDECRRTYTVAIASPGKSSRNVFGTIFVSLSASAMWKS